MRTFVIAFVAGLLASTPVRAQLSWVNHTQFHGAVGKAIDWIDFAILSGEQVSAPATVTLSIEGGCGNFAGATTVQVTMQRDTSSNWLVPSPRPPSLQLTSPGRCPIRIAHAGESRIGEVESHDPTTLRITSPSKTWAIEKLGTYLLVKPKVVDAGGFFAVGISVEFWTGDDCPLDRNGRGYRYYRTTDDDGIARFRIDGDGRVGSCYVYVALKETDPGTPLRLVVFDGERVSITSEPDHIDVLTRTPLPPVKLTLRDETGETLGSVPVRVRATTAVNGAGLTPDVPAAESVAGITDGDGSFSARLQSWTNDIAGYYDIVLVTTRAEGRIPVTQRSPGGGTPPRPRALTRPAGDLWWRGPDFNGWGMSVVQHGDKLFSVVFAYDYGSGDATWTVIPDGQWNEDHTRFSGTTYRTHGTPYHAYDAAKLSLRFWPGWASLMFDGDGDARLEFEDSRQSTPLLPEKLKIARQPFGGGVAPYNSLSDMWWGGAAQNGWGMSITQKEGTLFIVWYTYDENGEPTWFVMPGGTWNADTFAGPIYVTRAPGYESNPGFVLTVREAGNFQLKFSSANAAAFTYQLSQDPWAYPGPSSSTNTGTLQLQRQSF